MYQNILFLFQTKKHTHTNKKQKKLNKIENQRKPKKKRKNKMFLLLIISVENVTRYDDIIWEFALCTARVKKQKTLKSICIYLLTFHSRWKPRYVNALKTSLSIYSVHPSFTAFNIKMIEICTLQTVMSTLSKVLSLISKKICFSYVYLRCASRL